MKNLHFIAIFLVLHCIFHSTKGTVPVQVFVIAVERT